MKGKNKMKKVKKLTIILTILLLCLISFIGIYVQKQNVMTNIIKDYDLGMNLEGYREVRLKVAKKEEVTSEKVEEVKQLLEKRLKQLGAIDYLMKANYTTGEIVLELEETSSTDQIIADIYGAGNLKMVDSKDTTKVLMTNEDLKQVSLKYSTTESGTGIYLDLEFTEEGAKKIEDLSSNAYKTLEEEKKEETETTDEKEEKKEEEKKEEEKKEEEKKEDKQPKLTLMIDDNELVSSSFDTPITTGRLQLSLTTETTNSDTIQEAVNTGVAISTLLNNGPLPIKYELSSHTYIQSDITEEIKIAFVIMVAILIVIALTVLVIKYKMPALLAAISYIGFIALYLLVLRYANILISLEGVAGILVILIINYIFLQKLLEKSYISEVFKEMGIQLIPVIAVIIVFSFISWANIASFGMAMFWGLLLTVIYHFIVTRTLVQK